MGSQSQSLINDQWISPKENINDSMINDKDAATMREQYATRVANDLVKKFNAPNSYKFFLKCAYRLSEDQIWTIYERSQKSYITYPIKYFIKSCHKLPQMAD